MKTGFAYLTRENGTGKPGRFLIWAVTGAGKTEMIFPFIDRELRLGRKVLIATPRRDVVLELQPRLKRAFPDRKIVTLYGGSEERWEQGELTLATTHQLLRYHRSFDLVIIDEIDAFPYHNNPMLQFAAERVCRRSGAYVLLSATPPANLIRLANRGRLAHVKVPVRFHRHPLPVPRALRIKELSKWKDSLPGNVRSALKQSIDRGAQLFVFVPRIRDVEPMVKTIRAHLSGYAVEGTSSQDPERADKVVRFRQGDIRVLVTTTILERGVTVPKTDVFILQADSATFDSAALIQMAGRSGRSKDDPAGRVFFAAAALTNSQSRAIRQIRQMNRVAKRKGYLIDGKKVEGEKAAADRDNRTKGGL
ncbi:helicase-related protein [Paenibacillus hemerocallicola]|uniref:helicase-related protein n=1 Tax=Paenibacillus hemerocallicola TaxID=1172614 RepID=UPI001FE40B01|nr:helicase-related protein [Paenibacillus hemerocallicola]